MFKGFAIMFIGGLVGWVYSNINMNDTITPIVWFTLSLTVGFYYMWKEAEENNRDN